MIQSKSIAFLGLILILGACSGSDDVSLEGKREGVFKKAVVSNLSAENHAKIAEPQSVDSMPQLGEKSSHVQSHIKTLKKFEEVWSESIGEGNETFKKLFTPPITDGEKIYVMDSEGTVSALDMQTGEFKWIVKAREKGDFKSGGLAIHEGHLFATYGSGKMRAFESKSGKPIWEKDLKAPIHGAPSVDKTMVYAQTDANMVYGLSQKNGSQIFRFQGIEEETSLLPMSTPAVSGEDLVVGLSNGYVHLLKKETGSMIWMGKLLNAGNVRRAGMAKDVIAPPVIDGQYVYAVGMGDMLKAFERKSGKIKWLYPVGSSAMPLVSGQTIYVLSNEYEFTALNKKTGKVIWKKQLDKYTDEDEDEKMTYSTPVLANGQIWLVSSAEKLLRLNAVTGELDDKVDLDENVSFAPVFSKDMIFVLTDDGKIVAYK